MLVQIPLNIEDMRDEYNRERLISIFSSDAVRILQILGAFKPGVWIILFIKSPEQWGYTVRKDEKEIVSFNSSDNSLMVWYDDCTSVKLSLSSKSQEHLGFTTPPNLSATTYEEIADRVKSTAYWLSENTNALKEATGRMLSGDFLEWPIICKEPANLDKMFASQDARWLSKNTG